MRLLLLISFAIFALGSGGCAGYLAGSGHSLNSFKTQEEVQATFGAPVRVEEEDGFQVAYFHTRKKIADPVQSYSLKLGTAYSMGLFEPIALVEVTSDFIITTIGGQTINFTIDKEGNVVRSSGVGWSKSGSFRNKSFQEEPKPEEPEEPKEK